MKKLLEITLGIVTSIGGFLEAGSIATAAQAGGIFGYQLIWAVVLGTLCLLFLVEMSGRFAAASQHTIADALRDQFGMSFFAFPLAAIVIVVYLVLASELGGVALALQMATGIPFRWWAVPVAIVAWVVLWKGTFSVVEKGASLLGLVSVAFLVAVFAMHPEWHKVAASVVPSRPEHDALRYWFLAVSIIGASVSPYLLYFYSSGAIEDKWDEHHITINRVVATLGMTFGGTLSVAVLIVAALVFFPSGIQAERYEQLGTLLTPALGRWGFPLFAATLGITCFGAALEIALSVAYLLAQGFGWPWSKNQPPHLVPRFSLAFTVMMLLAAVPIALGIDPLKLTILSMALTAATLPLAIVPFLVLMNDERYVGKYRNHWISNAVVLVTSVLAFVLAIVTIPLELLGG